MEWNANMADRRKEPRYETRTEVTVLISGETHIGLMRNISGGGMEIKIPKEVSPTTRLTVSLKLRHEFVFQGTVIWAVGDYKNKQWVYRVGIMTDNISYNNKKAVEPQDKREVVKRLLPSIKKKAIIDILKIANAA